PLAFQPSTACPNLVNWTKDGDRGVDHHPGSNNGGQCKQNSAEPAHDHTVRPSGRPPPSTAVISAPRPEARAGTAHSRHLCRCSQTAMSVSVTIRRDRRRTGRIYCSQVPPTLEPIVKKPLAALAVVAAAVASVALPLTTLPAGAAASTGGPSGGIVPVSSDWVKTVVPCRVGHKSAVTGYSPTHPYWVRNGDSFQVNPQGWTPWFSNPCKGQWLVFFVASRGEQFSAVLAPPGEHGKA